MAHSHVTCEHEACHCEVAEQGKYCSEHCREAAEDHSPGQVCQCGHQACETASENDDE